MTLERRLKELESRLAVQPVSVQHIIECLARLDPEDWQELRPLLGKEKTEQEQEQFMEIFDRGAERFARGEPRRSTLPHD